MPQKKQTKNQLAKKQKSKKPVLKNQPKILLVGCGKMGEAMLKGWLNAGYKKNNIAFVEQWPATKARIKLNYGIKFINNDTEAKKFNPELIIFAVKPQDLEKTVPQYKNLVNSKRIFVSIAAGKTISFLENILGKNTKILRIMPNLPAAVNEAYIIGKANYYLEGKYFSVFQLLGYFSTSPTEELLDTITALSGSGPAYLFLFIESFIETAENLGFNKEAAKDLAVSVVFGSAKLALNSPKHPKELREDVSSKGGTTAAALEVLMGENGLKDLMKKAIAAAEARAKELQK